MLGLEFPDWFFINLEYYSQIEILCNLFGLCEAIEVEQL